MSNDEMDGWLVWAIWVQMQGKRSAFLVCARSELQAMKLIVSTRECQVLNVACTSIEPVLPEPMIMDQIESAQTMPPWWRDELNAQSWASAPDLRQQHAWGEWYYLLTAPPVVKRELLKGRGPAFVTWSDPIEVEASWAAFLEGTEVESVRHRTVCWEIQWTEMPWERRAAADMPDDPSGSGRPTFNANGCLAVFRHNGPAAYHATIC